MVIIHEDYTYQLYFPYLSTGCKKVYRTEITLYNYTRRFPRGMASRTILCGNLLLSSAISACILAFVFGKSALTTDT